jgi:hypothetical protein
MNVDELKAGFARLAEPVVPVEDAYGRLLRRARRSRRVRVTGWSSALAAAVVTVLLGSQLVQATGTPHPTPSVGVDGINGEAISPWVQRLLDTPPRGNLAADTGFTSAVTDRLRPGFFGYSPSLSQQTVLFADDVGVYRAVLVAFHSDTAQMAVWLVGDAGASASQLADAAAHSAVTSGATRTPGKPHTKVLPEELTPFTGTAVSELAPDRYLALGVAPAGCQVATRDDTHPQSWHDEATDDYVVRTDALAVAVSTFVRVTCDGVVRYQKPLISNARSQLAVLMPTERQIDAALTGARGTRPDRIAVRNSLSRMVGPTSDGLGMAASADGCKVLYSGRFPDSADSSAPPGGAGPQSRSLVTACTTTHGNTRFDVIAEDGSGNGLFSRVKLSDPRAVIGVRGRRVPDTTASTSPDGSAGPGMPTDDTKMLVLAPTAATRLEVAQVDRAARSVPLSGGVTTIDVPVGQTVQLRALDASGAVVGSGVGPVGEDIAEEHSFPVADVIDNWS